MYWVRLLNSNSCEGNLSNWINVYIVISCNLQAENLMRGT